MPSQRAAQSVKPDKHPHAELASAGQFVQRLAAKSANRRARNELPLGISVAEGPRGATETYAGPRARHKEAIMVERLPTGPKPTYRYRSLWGIAATLLFVAALGPSGCDETDG